MRSLPPQPPQVPTANRYYLLESKISIALKIVTFPSKKNLQNSRPRTIIQNSVINDIGNIHRRPESFRCLAGEQEVRYILRTLVTDGTTSGVSDMPISQDAFERNDTM
jgi:hypothetical protein